jgi:adenylate kinase family enzyme
MKKGYVLHGFPETQAQCVVMDDLGFSANRIFLLSCTETLCLERMAKKRKSIMKKQLPDHPLFYQRFDFGDGDRSRITLGQTPYAEPIIKARFEIYNENLEDIIRHYGNT